MRIELDHLFVCAAPAAPEAEQFTRFGLREAPSSRHPGQGTANRRFSFANAMIELLWVSDADEARRQLAKRTLLWERWSGRHGSASPFGICVRPADPQHTGPPFPAWEYRPPYLPDPLVMHIAETGVEEPMWVYLSFMRRVDREERFVEHPIGIREITALALTNAAPLRSIAAQRIIEGGILSNRVGKESILEIEFDKNRRKQTVDFRPQLPLIFQL
jgi:Glyoxalase-like domain